MSVLKINANDFDAAVKNGTVLVDFYADWCGPCRMVAPIVEEISAEREDVTFVKVNVDDATEIAIRFGIVSIPTLIVLKDGVEKSRIVGYRPKDAILAALDA